MTNKTPSPLVVLSNGYYRYHLSAGAVELSQSGHLHTFITGAYPTGWFRSFITSTPLGRHQRGKRLLDRTEKGLPESQVISFGPLEYILCAIYPLRKKPGLWTPIEKLRVVLFHLFGRLSVSHVTKAHAQGANIFHYRSGFGHAAARKAKELGMALLCDHTIAHPNLLQYLKDNEGRFPEPGTFAKDLPPMWAPVLDDLSMADFAFVNSDFVKDTFVHMGWKPENVYVVYQGVDDKFLNLVPPPVTTAPDTGPLKLLFAGKVSLRKGGHMLAQALKNLSDVDWRLEIAGSIDDDIREAHPEFFYDPRVKSLGVLSRADLATTMSRNEVFVFPSLAEGSARVVFEALACGAYVITTPNSGSVVRHGENGQLVPAGEPEMLAEAVRTANSQRGALREIGRANAEMVRRDYLQSHFGRQMVEVYEDILARKLDGAERAWTGPGSKE